MTYHIDNKVLKSKRYLVKHAYNNISWSIAAESNQKYFMKA